MENQNENPPDRGIGNGNGKDDDFVIIVNAQPKPVEDEEVSFEDVIELAFPGAGGGQGVIFSVTYRHAASKPHAGELSANQSVEVKKKGTVFNVTRTVQS